MAVRNIPLPKSKRRYYHATPSEDAARKIVSSGQIVPGASSGRGFLDPVPGRVYASPQLTYVLAYALWERPGTKFGKYGYLFEVDPASFDDVQPDEDLVGELAGSALGSLDEGAFIDALWKDQTLVVDLRKFAEKTLTETQRYNLGSGELKYQAVAGKKLVKEMLPDMQKKLIDLGIPIANKGPVKIRAAWKIPRTKKKHEYRTDADVREMLEPIDLVKKIAANPNRLLNPW